MTKKQRVIDFIKAGCYSSALKIAARFFNGFSKEEMKVIVRAHEMSWSPLYAQMGFKPEIEIAKAIEIIKAK